jgi:ribonucleotide monophosphatase NagD (HAD superfamily)
VSYYFAFFCIFLQPDPIPEVWDLNVAQTIAAGLDPKVGCVVASVDHQISYLKIMKAISYLNKPEVIYVATNLDERFPASKDCILPGNLGLALINYLTN